MVPPLRRHTCDSCIGLTGRDGPNDWLIPTGGLILIPPSEFRVKVAILASLTVVSAFVLLFDQPLERIRSVPAVIGRKALPGLALTGRGSHHPSPIQPRRIFRSNK
jgi:hypothetical protein